MISVSIEIRQDHSVFQAILSLKFDALVKKKLRLMFNPLCPEKDEVKKLT